ncbi:MAG TPA: hypothetical protein P5096_00740 [Patescibacteria group bacterium]|nr:hypothetical protein [Patescibacteria group bacterium]
MDDQNVKIEKNERQAQSPRPATWLGFDANDVENVTLVKKGRLWGTLRRGDRSVDTEDPKGGYIPGRFVKIKFQREDSSFDDSLERIVVITGSITKKFSEFSREELRSLLMECESGEECFDYIRSKYSDFKADEIVTAVKFEYIEDLKNAEDLLRTGIFNIAKSPMENPQDINADKYTLPLLAKDYPARTARLWNSAYKHFGIDTKNVMMIANPDDVEYILKVLKIDDKYQGGGCGVGFKEKAFRFVDELDNKVAAIKSLNYVKKNAEGKLIGYNTDGEGYVKGLEKLLEKNGDVIRGKRVLMIGAGGTANAIAFALIDKGANIFIANRTIANAEELVKDINSFYSLQESERVAFGGEDTIAFKAARADIIVNVSRKGEIGEMQNYCALAKAEGDITKNISESEKVFNALSRDCIITDVILRKEGEDTPLIHMAKERGLKTQNGLPMVVYQAAIIFSKIYSLPLDEVTKVMEEVENLDF